MNARTNRKKRVAKQLGYEKNFKDKQKELGFKEVRQLLGHEDDKDAIDSLIQALNEVHIAESDSDILFRIDNHSDVSIIPHQHVYVIIKGERVQVPNSKASIPAGGSFILRREQLEELIANGN